MGDRSRYVTTTNTAAPGSRRDGVSLTSSRSINNSTIGQTYSRIIQGSNPNRGTLATQSITFTSPNTRYLVDADVGSTGVQNAIDNIETLQTDLSNISTKVQNISGVVDTINTSLNIINTSFSGIYDSVKWLSNFNLSQPVSGEITIDATLNISALNISNDLNVSGDLNVDGTFSIPKLVVSSNISSNSISVAMLDVTNNISTSNINSQNINVTGNITIDGELSSVTIENSGNIRTESISVDYIQCDQDIIVLNDVTISGQLFVGGTATLPTINASNVSTDNISVEMLDVSGDVTIGGTATIPILNASNVSTDNISVGMLDVSGDVAIGGTATIPILNASNVSTDNISTGMIDVSGDVVIGGTATLPILNVSNVSTDNISVGMLDVSGDVVIGGTTTLPTLNASNVSADNISVGMLDVSGDVVIGGTATLPTLNASNVSADNISVNNISVLGDVTIDGTLVYDLTNNLSAGDGIILTNVSGKTTITSTATGYGSGPSLAVDANVSSFITSLTLMDNDDVLWDNIGDAYGASGDKTSYKISAKYSQNGDKLTIDDAITLNEGDTIVFNWNASHFIAGTGHSTFTCYLIPTGVSDNKTDWIEVGKFVQYLDIGGDHELASGSFTYIVPAGGFTFYQSGLHSTARADKTNSKASATCTIYRKTVPISSTSVTANVPVSDFILPLTLIKGDDNNNIGVLWPDDNIAGQPSNILATVRKGWNSDPLTDEESITLYVGDTVMFNWSASQYVNTVSFTHINCYLVDDDDTEHLVGAITQRMGPATDRETVVGTFTYVVDTEFSFYRCKMVGNGITSTSDTASATCTIYRSSVPNSVLIPQLLDATNVSCDNISVTTLECGNVSCDNISVTTLECGNVSCDNISVTDVATDTITITNDTTISGNLTVSGTMSLSASRCAIKITEGDIRISENYDSSFLLFQNAGHHIDCYYTQSGNARAFYINYYARQPIITSISYDISSDDRIKEEEKFIENATDTLLKLRPQTYIKYGAVRDSSIVEPNYNMSGRFESGLIAQEIYYDAPELKHLVSTNNKTGDTIIPSSDDPQQDPDYSSWGDMPASVNYIGLIPYIIKSNQELHERIAKLEDTINNM